MWITINQLIDLTISFIAFIPQKNIMKLLAFSHSDMSFSASPMKHILSLIITSLHFSCLQTFKCHIIFSSNTKDAFLLLESYNSRALLLTWPYCCFRTNIFMNSLSSIYLRFFFSLSSGYKMSFSSSFLWHLLLCKSILWYFPWKLHPSTKQVKVALETRISRYFSS